MPPSKNISFDELSKYFHLPINQVAKELGVCATILKKICRRNGIPRWPHRKIKSLDKMISNLEVNLAKNPAEREEINSEVELLKNKKMEIMRNPDILVSKNRNKSQLGPHMKKTKPKGFSVGSFKIQDLTSTDDDSFFSNSSDLSEDFNWHRPSVPPTMAPHSQEQYISDAAILAARRPSLPIIPPYYASTPPTISLPPPATRRHSIDTAHLELGRIGTLNAVHSGKTTPQPTMDLSLKLPAFNFAREDSEQGIQTTTVTTQPTEPQNSLPDWFVQEKQRVLGHE